MGVGEDKVEGTGEEIEAPYNYFGERGIVDLAFYHNGADWGTNRLVLREFKTEIVDIGETIRQIKKAHKYFALANTHVGRIRIIKENLEILSILILADTPKNREDLEKYDTLLSNLRDFNCQLMDDSGLCILAPAFYKRWEAKQAHV